MKEDGGGNIVNIASFGGIMPPMYRSAYCTSKHAINWLTGARQLIMHQPIAPYGGDTFKSGKCDFPERVTHFTAQMRSVTYPGTKVKFLGWKTDEHTFIFKLMGDNGKAILDNGILEFR